MKSAPSSQYALFLLLFFCTGLTLSDTRKSIDLQDAIKQGIVKAKFKSNGKHRGNSVIIQLNNLTSAAQTIRIPAGSLFLPAEEGEQTLLQLEDQHILVEGKSLKQFNIPAFCSEAGDRCPSENKEFSLSKTTNPKFIALSQFLAKTQVDKNLYQDALWVLSDQHELSHIDASTSNAKALRDFLAVQSGQKNNWYSTPREVRIDSNGNFSFQTVKVSGELAFDCQKGSTIQQDICKEDGSTVHKGTKAFTPVTNHVRYHFNLAVTGWEKGKYFVKVYDGSKTLARYDFSI